MPDERKPGLCPECNTELVFAEIVLDMWCPHCRKYLSELLPVTRPREESGLRFLGVYDLPTIEIKRRRN